MIRHHQESIFDRINPHLRSNGRSHSKRIYQWKVEFHVEDERYCTSTNKILPSPKILKLQSSNHDQTEYNPHVLLREDPRSYEPYDTHEEYLDLLHYYFIKKRARLLGDVPIEYNKKTLIRTPEQLDKLNSQTRYPFRLTEYERRARQIAREAREPVEGDYILQKEDYAEVVRNLTRTQRNRRSNRNLRPYRRVYFSHEIRYYPRDQAIPESEAITPTKVYIPTGQAEDNAIIIGQAVRGPREVHSSTLPHQSILKLPTRQKCRDDYWTFRLRYNGVEHPNHSEVGPTTRYRIYQELLRDTSENFSHWFETVDTVSLDTPTLNLKYRYYINRKFRHDLIDEAVVLSRTHNRAASKIIRIFRLWKIRVIERKILRLQQELESHYNRFHTLHDV
jgi:hypothetical protein